MSRKFQRGDRVRVEDGAWSGQTWTVLMLPHKLNYYRVRLVTAGGCPRYARLEDLELVESIEERVAKELMA